MIKILQFQLLLISLLFTLKIDSKTFDKCELARELKNNPLIPFDHVGTWVCIAEKQSNFQTSTKGYGLYGIFKIGSEFWCNEDDRPSKGCGISCSKLIDNDISDDIECAQKIYKEHGFKAWGSGSDCEKKGNSYIDECASGKVYDRCELARELRETPLIPYDQIGTWVCIAEKQSGLRTSAEGDGAYGIFKIGNEFWCDEDENSNKACGLYCLRLTNNDIQDDIECALKIYKQHGFKGWANGAECQRNRKNYVQGCFGDGTEKTSQDLQIELENHQIIKSCGNVNHDPGLVHGGKESDRAESPWKAALFNKAYGVREDYFCGGSLITEEIVITAAHCIHQKREASPKNVRNVEVMLGAHNIDDDSEFGRQVFGVKEFIIHENWNPSIVKYNDDIALVRLSSPAEFTLSVQPICLMSIDEKFDHGKVVGWGEINDNGEISDVAKTVELKTTQTLPCVLNHHVYARIAWDESFCAHSEKSGVCRGDSGSGFYVKYNGKTYLKGLVSSAIKKACSDNAVALYTDITKYFSSFIKKKI